jgi:hypothetical protein
LLEWRVIDRLDRSAWPVDVNLVEQLHRQSLSNRTPPP